MFFGNDTDTRRFVRGFFSRDQIKGGLVLSLASKIHFHPFLSVIVRRFKVLTHLVVSRNFGQKHTHTNKIIIYRNGGKNRV